MRQPHLSSAPVRALALAIALAACDSRTGEPPPTARDWDVVVVLLDALPASALGSYGYATDVSPNLDAFAAQSLRAEQAFSSASYTMASVASLFTSLGPATHGVVGLNSNVLREGFPTLAEQLARKGLATAAFSCNPHITREAGFAQGFEHFQHYDRDRFDAHTVPAALFDDVASWWRGAADRQRFLYVHLLPPHQPYDPPEPYLERFAPGVERELGLTNTLVELNERGAGALDAELLAGVRARYDAGLAYADAQFARLLDTLAAEGGLDEAAIVVLSDHGEAFGEHGRVLHGQEVFATTTRVPLLVKLPGAKPGVVPGLLRTRDLGPTLCELVDAPWPAREPAPHSFLEQLLDPASAEGGPSAISRSVGTQPLWALRDGAWTLVAHPSSGARHLFHRAADPGEFEDLAAREPERLERMAAELERRLEAERAAAPKAPRERVTNHLRAIRDLGYVGAFDGED